MTVNNLIYENKLSDAEYESLTKDEQLLWIMRPRSNAISEIRFWMIVRASLLGIALIYYIVKYGIFLDHDFLIGILFCYEFAYYSLRKEKEERIYIDALSKWNDKIDELNKQ